MSLNLKLKMTCFIMKEIDYTYLMTYNWNWESYKGSIIVQQQVILEGTKLFKVYNSGFTGQTLYQ